MKQYFHENNKIYEIFPSNMKLKQK
jgi:hypothetical protein